MFLILILALKEMLMKKSVLFILCLALLACLMAFSAFASEVTSSPILECGHEVEAITYGDFTQTGTASCKEGCLLTVDAIFEHLGYAGTAYISNGTVEITCAYSVNRECLALYRAVNGEDALQYGIVAASRNNCDGKAPLNSDSTVPADIAKYVERRSFDGREIYATADAKLWNISINRHEADCYLSMYIYDGEKTVYVTENGCADMPDIISYDDLIEFDVIDADKSCNADTELNIGELFAPKDSAIYGESEITVTVTDPIGNEQVQNVTIDTLKDISLTFEKTGTYTVKVLHHSHCAESIATVKVSPIDKLNVKFTNTNKYLYRVGNQNSVTLGSLFSKIEGTVIDSSSVTVLVEALTGSADFTYTQNTSDWTKSTVKFTGTGTVRITVSCMGGNDTVLNLEVINATNVTAYSELKNQPSVLLDNITMSSGGSYYLSGATLYGNGFTFDISQGAYTGTGAISNNYIIQISNANLDNIQIVGAVYTEYGAQAKDNYNRPAVLSIGSCTIKNSYISNCAAPVRIRDGALEIVNTTLKGGNFANLDIRGGSIVLEDVTTINQSPDNDPAADGTSVVGLGIVIYYENVQDATTITIKGSLTQYNHISDNDQFSNAYAQQLVNDMLGSTHSDLQLEKDGITWANAGIVIMLPDMSDNVIGADSLGYIGKDVTFASRDGYVYTTIPTEQSIAASSPVYTPTKQGEIAPAYSFDYTDKNYVAKADGSNDYCYEENGTVYISMDQGDSFSWDTSILTVTKDSQSLTYTVTMNGVDYTGKKIVFNTSGNYEITYTYTDSYNYGYDGISTHSKTYQKTVFINVSVIKPSTQHAEFTFGSEGTGATSVTIGNNTYVMPNVSGTSSTVGSITVGGATVYYQIVDAYTSDGATAHSAANSWYMCYPVFKNVITITDYENGGSGAKVVYGSSTTVLPSGLSLSAYSNYVNGGTAPSGSVGFTEGGADKAFKYQASSSASSTPKTLGGTLIYASPTLSNNARNELFLLVQYKYQDNAGATYYYYVGYHMPQTTVKNVCVTPDTLVTLADGTQKRIDQVTYADQLLVWDFFNGTYAYAPSSIIFNHGYDTYEVLALNFDDGTTVKVINNHGFFDVSSNRFVIIDKENVESYLGNSFVKVSGDTYGSVKLSSYSITEEYTGSYSIQTAQHNNFIVEGMFSITMPEYDGWFDYFEIGSGMKYDREKMEADIEKYGLYTYDDLKEYVTYEQFIAFSGPYLKVLVGRGVVTFDDILALIEKYVP